MQSKSQTIASRKIVIEIEIAGDNQDFEFCEQLCNTYINYVSQVVQVKEIHQRLMWTAYLKPTSKPNKDRARAKLPKTDSNGATKVQAAML
jgi:hypothetical protein